MREIKFRAWDKGIGSMCPWDELQPWEDGKDIRWWNDPDLILMQYTGLKDKNGVKIYEGDIIKKPNNGIFIVEYMKLDNCGDCTNDDGIGFNFYLQEPEECEVIGNIYENPELLNS